MNNLPSKKKTKTSKALAGAISAFTPDSSTTTDEAASPSPSFQPTAESNQTATLHSDNAPLYQPLPLASKGRVAKTSAIIGGVINTVRQKVTGQHDEIAAKQFKDWAVTAFASEFAPLPEASQAILGWLMVCSSTELQTLMEQVAHHCTTQNLSLSWLLDAQQVVSPQLKQATATSVMLYCLAAHAALQAQAEIALVTRFQHWQANPGDAPMAAVFQQIFVELVREQLLPGPPSELLLTSQKYRTAYLVEALSRFANHNPEIFYARLKAQLDQ